MSDAPGGLPAPMTPPDCDLRGYDFMPLFGQRLFSSEMYATTNGNEFRAALKLWWAAWQECPAGSLTTNDATLAVLADFGRDVKGWLRVKDKALHGFILCADGRMYHPFLCREALEAFDKRLKQDAKRETDRKRLQAWREARKTSAGGAGSEPGGNAGGNADETRFKGSGNAFRNALRNAAETRMKSVDSDRDIDREERTPCTAPRSSETVAPAEPSPARTEPRGQRLPDDWQPGSGDCEFAAKLGLDVAEALAEFRDYWRGVPGSRGRRCDWPATWRNSCRKRADALRAAGQRRETADDRVRRELGISSILDFRRAGNGVLQ